MVKAIVRFNLLLLTKKKAGRFGCVSSTGI